MIRNGEINEWSDSNPQPLICEKSRPMGENFEFLTPPPFIGGDRSNVTRDNRQQMASYYVLAEFENKSMSKQI